MCIRDRGYSSLAIIEEAKHVYLFEQNEAWLEAIRATLEPWKDKVTMVQKYVSNRNSPKEQKLDDFFRDKPDEHLFIKMDIEGAERRAPSSPLRNGNGRDHRLSKGRFCCIRYLKRGSWGRAK